jgi:hypothetical protein
VVLADLRVLWIFVGVCQCHEDDPPSEGPEGVSVDASQTPEEVPATCSGETPYPGSYASTTAHRRTPVITGCGVLEGESRYRPPTEEET